jgi:hypothetical protein
MPNKEHRAREDKTKRQVWGWLWQHFRIVFGRLGGILMVVAFTR